MIYLTTTGRAVFGLNNAAKNTITSTDAYNDGAWHHVMATAGSAGMRLYLNGTQVASSTTTIAASNSGFLRLGYDNLALWPNAPASNFFSAPSTKPPSTAAPSPPPPTTAPTPAANPDQAPPQSSTGTSVDGHQTQPCRPPHTTAPGLPVRGLVLAPPLQPATQQRQVVQRRRELSEELHRLPRVDQVQDGAAPMGRSPVWRQRCSPPPHPKQPPPNRQQRPLPHRPP